MKEIKKDFILQDDISASNSSNEKETNIEQSVVINADFPAVTNAKEIEKAFDSLENMATQKAYSTKKR
jgi:ribosomal protein L5